MKVNISNRQYKKIIDESIKNAIVLNEAPNDVFIKSFKNDIENQIQSRLDNDSNFRNQADEIGITPDYSDEARKNYISQIKNTRGKYRKSVNDEIKAVVKILRDNTNSTGGVNFRKINNEANANAYSVNGEPLTYSRILRIKDFIDSMSLRYLYDSSVSPTQVQKFGLNNDPNNETPENDFDINTITDSHFNDYKGHEKNDGNKKNLTTNDLKKAILDKYLQSAYGIKFDAPSFDLGNKKVVGALMINFTSAYKCPAWNECLVKHACYARAGETRHYNNAKTSNDRKNLMWLACEDDPKMLNLVYNLLKSYVVGWTAVKRKLAKNPELFNSVGGDINKLSQMYFSEMPQEVLEVIKECKRVSYIRLNENGDFINQKLLDSFDQLAGDFKLIGVNTAAYSCRNLQFDKLKNIIINASRTEMEGPTIQRYFYAVPVKMYEAFEDTYTSASMSNSFDSIGKLPKPLFSIDANGNKTPNGSFYYKCPCSRNDFTLIGDNGEAKENSEVNCYQCHLCYETNSEEMVNALRNGGKFYVFVKAHGTFANMLDEKREKKIIDTVGVPENYQIGMRDTSEGYDNSEPVAESKSLINESSMQNEAFVEITKNAIYSMTEHFKGIGMNENKSNFFSKAVKKINEEKKGKK